MKAEFNTNGMELTIRNEVGETIYRVETGSISIEMDADKLMAEMFRMFGTFDKLTPKNNGGTVIGADDKHDA